MPEFWEDIDYKILSILKNNLEVVNNLDSRSSLQLQNSIIKPFYVEPVIRELSNEKTKKNIKKASFKNKKPSIKIYDKIKSEKFILIQASMGGGKSKLLREIHKHYSKPEIFNVENTIPILTSYTDFVNVFNKDINKVLDFEIKTKLKGYTGNLNYLVLIDGFDEKYTQDYHKQYEDINYIFESSKAIANTKIIITSRDIINNAQENNSLIPNTNILEISPLNSRQLNDFIKILCEDLDIKNRIFNDLKNTSLIDDISHSPIAAIILVELLNVNSKDLPSNLTELYSKYLEVVLGRWDLDKGLIGQKEYDVTETVILNISFDLIKNQRQNLSYQEFLDYFKTYIKKRTYDFSYEELAEKTIERYGVLYLDKEKNTVNFKHRSFVEFFCSKKHFNGRTLVIDERAFNPYWMNIYFFYFGLQRDCADHLKELMSLELDHHFKDFIRIMNMSNFILASYNTETDVICEVMSDIIIKSSILYNNIINGKYPESPLINVSQLNLLGVFQLILKEKYGYTYFDNCLDSVLNNIETTVDEDNIKMVAELFTSLIGMEIKNYFPLEYFLEKYKSNIGVELKLMLLIEGKDIEKESAKIKRIFRNLHRSVDSNKKYLNNIIKNNISTYLPAPENPS